MAKPEVPEQIKNDKMYQFLNKMNNGINESVALYQLGKESAADLAKNLMDYGKQLSSYVSDLSKAQTEKFSAMTKYVNAVNPVLKKDQAAELTPEKMKDLESTVLKTMESQKSISVEKTQSQEASIGR